MNEDYSVRVGESDGYKMLGRVLVTVAVVGLFAFLGWLFSHMAY